MKQQYENNCPLCGYEVEFQGDHEINIEVGTQTDCSWECPHCGATGVQVNNIIFEHHVNVENVDGESVDLDEIDIAAPIPAHRPDPLVEAVLDMIETDCGEHLAEIIRMDGLMEVVSDHGSDRFIITVTRA